MTYVNSKTLFEAYLSGANKVLEQREALNRINVFPVADGDTGNNLASLMRHILSHAKVEPSTEATMASIATAALEGARGNSGIILAQYFQGISLGIPKNKAQITYEELALAHIEAVPLAYAAIDQPVEGTMLTALRFIGEWLEARLKVDGDKVVEEEALMLLNALDQVVDGTKEQMKILRQAKVVDAGAKGIKHFVEGIVAYIKGEKVTLPMDQGEPLPEFEGHIEENLTFKYCTEAIITGEDLGPDQLKKILRPHGDALLVAGIKNRFRCHIHTDSPYDVMAALEKIGKITYQKVEDMQGQNNMMVGRKHPIALVTDSVADLPRHIIEDNQIYVVPLKILTGDGFYLDKLTIDPQKALRMTEQERLTSSQPDLKEVNLLLGQLVHYYEQVIILPVAKALSGTYNVFEQAIKTLDPEGNKTLLVDTRQNSISQGLMVYQVATWLNQGLSFETISTRLKALPGRTKIYVAVSDMDAMVRSGRLSLKAAKVAKVFRLTPIVTLDETGKGGLAGMAIGQKQALKKIKQKVATLVNAKVLQEYGLIDIENPELVKHLEDDLRRLTNQAPLYSTQTSSIIALSAGQGAVALGVIVKEGYHDL